ncbi:cation-translocating P-type ATPase [Paracrocinitomix mangrovi]|uniref:cation-translocating P-type ATPase n=1 Tax=Paracrocinitomix mangrovi TaxID=2862509 RepID=UPI001C8DC208|nr:cation-translocating P-type ATPase [Paracrocinitomix mangrovi]
MQKGLSSENASNLLKEYGYNELPTAKPKNIGRIALEVVKEPMFILLLICGLLYLLLGDYYEGIVLLCWIFIIIFITFYQYRKTEKSLDALRQLSSPRALVIRDGLQIRIPGREVVPGDIVLLNEGDRVPADATVIESNHLTIDESLLTGESVPVLKGHDQTKDDIFSGTLVVQGSGLVEVKSTGVNTEFGKIGTSLKSIEKGTSPLQGEMKLLIRNLFIIGAIISVGVITAFYFTRGNFIESMINGLAAAMALLPEEFPVVLTIFMALGAWRLSKNKVLTRVPSTIETLGSATVLCSDKTGTITQNKMEVAVLYHNNQTYKKEDFVSNKNEIENLLINLNLASTKDSIDPMEQAIFTEHEKLFASNHIDQLLKEYPLSKDLFAMTRVIKMSSNNTIAFCKGAPEAVLKLCRLSEEESQRLLDKVHQFAAQGYRMIAAAKCELKDNNFPSSQSEFEFEFNGLVGFEDPIRPEVPDAIKECIKAGIKVIMITGDYPATAKSIATQIGLEHNDQVITGSELKEMSLDDLKNKIQDTQIFARIVPEQKLQIIEALKANNEIVAMTGDGVNDAPALKAADIGVAMGFKGTDVARESSSLVLLDDNFASIVSAIRSGRKIFDNLQKAMSYIIAIHIPIIGLVLMPAFFSTLPILLMPMHIVFMELIIDPTCSIAFESEQEEKEIMNRPPRNPNERFFGWQKIMYSLLNGLLLLSMVVIIYFISIKEGHSETEVRTIAFSSLIIGNIFLILSSLSTTRSFISVFKERNKAVYIIIFSALAVLLLVINVPFFQEIFSFTYPGSQHFVSAFLGALGLLLVLEIIKWVRFNRAVSK